MTRLIYILPLVFSLALAGAVSVVKERRAAREVLAEAQPVVAPANDREQWAVDFLAALGNAQPTGETVGFVVSWTLAEDSGDGALARNNALNTTICGHNWTGAINSDGACGVGSYGSYQDGINATVDTIMQANFSAIAAALQANDPEAAKAALWASPWASSHYGYGSGWPAYAVEDTRGAVPPVSLPSCPTCDTPHKARVTESAYTSASFTTTDCGAWGFQVNCQHWGTDFMGDEGTPVYAPFDLTIIALGEYPPGPTWGQYVQGTFPDGYVFYSGHLENRPDFQVGETVPVGTVIGMTNSYNHTHIQLAPPNNFGACAQNGTCVDFEEYFNEH